MSSIDWEAAVRNAADFLEQHPDRWTRGAYAWFDTNDGCGDTDDVAIQLHTDRCQVCAIGAIALVLHEQDLIPTDDEFVEEHGPFGWIERSLDQEYGINTHSIISVNDEAGREAGISILRHTADQIRRATTA